MTNPPNNVNGRTPRPNASPSRPIRPEPLPASQAYRGPSRPIRPPAKDAFGSKTVLFNAGAVALMGTLAALWPQVAPMVGSLLPEQVIGGIGAAIGIGNMVLRTVTSQPITWGLPDEPPSGPL